MDLATSKTYASARGYTIWATKSDPELSAALLKADDYIVAHYRLREELTADELERRDRAQFMLALDFITNGDPVLRADRAAITKEEKEGAGFRKLVEYSDSGEVIDAYPTVTALLVTIAVRPSGSQFSFGRLVR